MVFLVIWLFEFLPFCAGKLSWDMNSLFCICCNMYAVGDLCMVDVMVVTVEGASIALIAKTRLDPLTC